MNTLMIGIDMLGEILSAFIIGLIITGLAALVVYLIYRYGVYLLIGALALIVFLGKVAEKIIALLIKITKKSGKMAMRLEEKIAG
ncbi:hypothetical protein O2U01_11140 (plasmid) [Ligilactobacillus salivarius]|uniref:Uncharacterized protein n=1 Tax=Ligilactobacillus salivarius TaxID=1624 RepID=A0AAQ3EW80_9LACO|nr:hypothetical protein [Ligilactobacillus salivarius]WHS05221.1 hypothetical protein O2U07_01895 [Ligilactobacillus salivarius]WHS05245.1 hypothetical protein O2U07_01175 [Ligilactobacillus salivarius]WHS07107.1 hypothetical protein O2U05_00615 [Ligilactobacillus salivarius]WHS07144.1 hypothetical protein O2U05_00820 [Ligilactobacillus salivarius]WHS07168.1 hypothetical protein O2U05_00090 [Ligilactobacillus salivarius]